MSGDIVFKHDGEKLIIDVNGMRFFESRDFGPKEAIALLNFLGHKVRVEKEQQS